MDSEMEQKYYQALKDIEDMKGSKLLVFQVYLINLGRLSPGTPVSSTNKTDHDDIAAILLKVALNTIKQTKTNIQLVLS
jgi:hypothetical protein